MANDREFSWGNATALATFDVEQFTSRKKESTFFFHIRYELLERKRKITPTVNIEFFTPQKTNLVLSKLTFNQN